MKLKHSISIIIPTLNEEKYLPGLLEDLSGQTFKNFKTIIVDAQSTDKTIDKAKQFKSLKPVVVISPEKNVSIQRNLGAKKTTTPWLIFMDADSRVPPNFLKDVSERLLKNNPGLFICWANTNSTNIIDNVLSFLMNCGVEIDKILKNPGGFGAMLGVKRSVFQQVYGFNPLIAWGEDHELISRAYKEGFLFQIFSNPKYTFSFRRLHKVGTLTFIYRYLRLRTMSIFYGRPQHPPKDYPMMGGSYYKTDLKESVN